MRGLSAGLLVENQAALSESIILIGKKQQNRTEDN
jgi:hypothetical protein